MKKLLISALCIPLVFGCSSSTDNLIFDRSVRSDGGTSIAIRKLSYEDGILTITADVANKVKKTLVSVNFKNYPLSNDRGERFNPISDAIVNLSGIETKEIDIQYQVPMGQYEWEVGSVEPIPIKIG